VATAQMTTGFRPCRAAATVLVAMLIAVSTGGALLIAIPSPTTGTYSTAATMCTRA